jgi:hypothetical protein
MTDAVRSFCGATRDCAVARAETTRALVSS